MMRRIVTGTLAAAMAAGLVSIPSVTSAAGKQLVYGYVTPGPDTWYKKDVDGFVFAAEKAGAKVIVLNSNYDPDKEIANIDSLINQGVEQLARGLEVRGRGVVQAGQRAYRICSSVEDELGPLRSAGVF